MKLVKRNFLCKRSVAISAESLAILKTYNVNVSQFIRSAIKEKLQKDWKTIKENKTKEYCPF